MLNLRYFDGVGKPHLFCYNLIGDIMDYSPTKMQEKLDSNSFNLKKKFGQNFIVDENIINSIITKSEIDNNTMVIEIGPGAGSLTYKLSKVAKNVLCYEIDTTLENVLKDNLRDCNNIEIKYQSNFPSTT